MDDFTYVIHGGNSADVITGGDRFSEVGDEIDGGAGQRYAGWRRLQRQT